MSPGEREQPLTKGSLGDRQARTPTFISYNRYLAARVTGKIRNQLSLKELHRVGMTVQDPLQVLAGNLGAAILAPAPV